jgi:hypothetical protein
MLRPAIMVPFILGSILAAWLRFDAGSMLLSWIVMLICIAVTLASSVRESKHAPQLTLPPECEALSSKDRLTPKEEETFTKALRAWHVQQQRKSDLEIRRRGPRSLIWPRAAIHYFWLCVFAIALLPSTSVPSRLMPQLPRSAVVLLSLAAIALAAAVPLGLRDWTRVRKSLEAGMAAEQPDGSRSP